MKKNNLWRIIWIVGIYATLVTILYLVVLYKVKWEDKDLNTYLYFYKCSNNICTSTELQSNYYNRILCKDKICPFITEIDNNIAILSDNKTSYIYDYVNDKIINDKYNKYYLTKEKDTYIAVNDNNMYGVIDKDDNILVDFNYQEITDYLDGIIEYKENNKYGIDINNKNIKISAKYDDIVLINSYIFAYSANGKYQIAQYNNHENNLSKESYDYIYSYNNAILAFNNNTLDILNETLNSILLIKINTKFSYKTEKERESLNFSNKNNILYFTIYNDNTYQNYAYDTKNKKLL